MGSLGGLARTMPVRVGWLDLGTICTIVRDVPAWWGTNEEEEIQEYSNGKKKRDG